MNAQATKKHLREREPDISKLSAKAMLENHVASITDYTGFVPRIPDSEEVANYITIFAQTPPSPRSTEAKHTKKQDNFYINCKKFRAKGIDVK